MFKSLLFPEVLKICGLVHDNSPGGVLISDKLETHSWISGGMAIRLNGSLAGAIRDLRFRSPR